MATELQEFPRQLRKGTSRFDEVLDGRIWRLVQGEDFNSTIPSYRSGVSNIASKRGMKVRTHIDRSNGKVALIVQAYPAKK